MRSGDERGIGSVESVGASAVVLVELSLFVTVEGGFGRGKGDFMMEY